MKPEPETLLIRVASAVLETSASVVTGASTGLMVAGVAAGVATGVAAGVGAVADAVEVAVGVNVPADPVGPGVCNPAACNARFTPWPSTPVSTPTASRLASTMMPRPRPTRRNDLIVSLLPSPTPVARLILIEPAPNLIR